MRTEPPPVESNFMGPTEVSDTHDYREDSDTPKGTSETTVGDMSRIGNATTKEVREPHEVDTSGAEHDETKNKVEQVSGELEEEGTKCAAMANTQVENAPTHDMLPCPFCLIDDPEERRSWHETLRQAQDLYAVGESAHEQFERAGSVEDVNTAIDCWEGAVALSQDSRMEQWDRLTYLKLGAAYTGRFRCLRALSDLNKAIQSFEKAESLTPNDHPHKPGTLNNLWGPYMSGFNCLDELSDLSKAIESPENVVSITPDDHLSKPGRLYQLGDSYMARFNRLGGLPDLSKAIGLYEQTVSLTPDGHQEKPERLGSLGISYWARFEHLGSLSDLTKVIQSLEEAASITPNGHRNKPGNLNNLGNSYMAQFQRLGEPPDLSRAIECHEQTVSLTLNGDPNKPKRLNNLGISYTARFELLGEISDLNKTIDSHEQAASLTTNNHPDKLVALILLGSSYKVRFKHLSEVSDLRRGIECLEEGISITPNGHPEKIGRLSQLGASYMTLFERLGELSDLRKGIETLEEAVSIAPDGHPDKPVLLNSLGRSYRNRFERLGELSDLGKAIEFHEHVVSLAPDDHAGKPEMLSDLGTSYMARFTFLDELSALSKAMECYGQAISLTPNDHPDKLRRLSSLGVSYGKRFQRLGEISDLNKAIELQVEVVSLSAGCRPLEPGPLATLGTSYMHRFERLGELSDLSKAIESHEQADSLIPNDDPYKPQALSIFGGLYLARFRRLGELPDLSKGIEITELAVSLTPDGHPDKSSRVSNLGVLYLTRSRRLGELPDLSKAIELQSAAISLIPRGHPIHPEWLNNLGNSYILRFEHLGEISDLSGGIEFIEQAVSLTLEGHPSKVGMLGNLGNSYMTRFEHLGELPDLTRAEKMFKSISQSPTGSPSLRFNACRRWAELSLFDPMLSPFPAYQQAMSLIPKLVWIGTTIGCRYELVTEVSNFATEAASYAISTGRLDLALEWLEAGRSIVWGQIAQLRTPFEYLSDSNPKLAEDLANVGRQLEHAESRPSLPSSPDISGPDLATEANTHIKLALEWDRLLEEIRSMTGFKDFLCSPVADQLLSVAKMHPVAIINLHKSRCDALILQPGSDTISHVSLPNFSFEDAVSARSLVISQVRDRKIGQRLIPPRPHQSSLEGMWSGMIKPILDFLGYTRKLSVDQLPRITWCTTGLLSFLPLHTARSCDESQPGAFDLVISSFTPTLSALLPSQLVDTSSSCGILSVGEESTPGLSNLPCARICTTEELAVIHKHTGGDYYLQLEGEEATIEQVLDAMDQFSWVHMACHGSQDPYDPTKSAFHLHDGNLTLAAITKRSFTNMGLAFLSACQTATGDENMPDEAVHLAAGMLMAGYPSVIGTMWSIADEDAPKVADLVYSELLKDGKMDHTNAARALHRAVAQLREKVGVKRVERWAPFIHIGV